jgi:HNH/ENDO VII superfamily nuclease
VTRSPRERVHVDGLTGEMDDDAPAANAAAGLDRTPRGYTWHHVEDGKTMELVLANDLQERLAAGVRHWTVRFEGGEWRRNLEVPEGDRGIWRVRPVGELVELAPASTTAIVRELIALIGRSASRSAAP